MCRSAGAGRQGYRLGDNHIMLGRLPIHRLSRLVLAWFVLSIGAAVASPVLSPQSMAILCTANGVSLVKVTFDDVASDQLGDKVHSSATMDCPLCWMPMAGAPAQMRLPSPQLDSGLIASATWLQARLSPRYSLPARAPPAI